MNIFYCRLIGASTNACDSLEQCCYHVGPCSLFDVDMYRASRTWVHTYENIIDLPFIDLPFINTSALVDSLLLPIRACLKSRKVGKKRAKPKFVSMSTKSYPSDLSQAQWNILEALLPKQIFHWQTAWTHAVWYCHGNTVHSLWRMSLAFAAEGVSAVADRVLLVSPLAQRWNTWAYSTGTC